MAKFLTTQGTSYHLENLILKAEQILILISPYLQISKTLYERLKDASNRNVKIIIVYGKKELKNDEEAKIMVLRNVQLLFFENLHAKCFLNEQELIVTSMNIYEFSEKNNREMGILINRISDSEMFEDASREVESIISSADRQTSFDKEQVFRHGIKEFNDFAVGGTCIRCCDSIKFNTNKPMCYECYISWSQFGNWDYPEKYCHQCSAEADTTMEFPICHSC